MIVFMLRHLKLAGCPFPSESIQCYPCDDTRSGGFAADYGILVCQNQFYNKRHLEETLSHELIHAFDHCRFKVDWYNLRHQACSEIRAANLSGECRMGREFQRRRYGFNKHHQECVKRRAVLSVTANPNCKSPEEATRAVNQVWDSCFQDTRPFDAVSRYISLLIRFTNNQYSTSISPSSPRTMPLRSSGSSRFVDFSCASFCSSSPMRILLRSICSLVLLPSSARSACSVATIRSTLSI